MIGGRVPHHAVILIGFVAAYCVQPILVDLIKFSGGAHSSTFLVLLPHYYSMVLVGMLPKEKSLRDCSWSDWRKGILLSGLDIVNQLLKKAGLVFSGAGIYIIVESSSMVWTVFWSRLLLQKKLTFLQWLSILLISGGIALRACQLTFTIQNKEFLGVLFILLSSVLMGLTFVLFELFINQGKASIPGPSLVFMMGVSCSIVMTLWTLIWTVPRYDILLIQEIVKKKGNPLNILLFYFFLLLSGWLHSATLWYLVKTLGAISSGVTKGLKVAIVFIISHYLFCDRQPGQCLNLYTGTSAAICTLGVVMYTVVTASPSKPKSSGNLARFIKTHANQKQILSDEKTFLIQSNKEEEEEKEKEEQHDLICDDTRTDHVKTSRCSQHHNVSSIISYNTIQIDNNNNNNDDYYYDNNKP